jgi:hypothetical protein
MSKFMRNAAIGVIVVALAVTMCAEAQTPIGGASSAQPDARAIVSPKTRMANPPKLPDGHPDLQGFWTNVSVTGLQRTGKITALVLTPEEADRYERSNTWNLNEQIQKAAVEVDKPPPGGAQADFATKGYNSFWLDPGRHFATVKGEIRSSWLIEPANGRLPTRPAALAVNSGGGFGTFDGPETRPLAEQCLVSFSRSAGPVMQNSLYNNNFQIVQGRDAVVIDVEMNHDARVIPLFATKEEALAHHKPKALTPWFGDSVGWYDGDALMVETVNVNPKQRSQLSPSGKLTERFSRWSDEQILYEFTVEDPDYYTATWKGEMSLNRSRERLYEYACHEGNYALHGILAGARVQEAAGHKVGSNLEEEK